MQQNAPPAYRRSCCSGQERSRRKVLTLLLYRTIQKQSRSLDTRFLVPPSIFFPLSCCPFVFLSLALFAFSEFGYSGRRKKNYKQTILYPQGWGLRVSKSTRKDEDANTTQTSRAPEYTYTRACVYVHVFAYISCTYRALIGRHTHVYIHIYACIQIYACPSM